MVEAFPDDIEDLNDTSVGTDHGFSLSSVRSRVMFIVESCPTPVYTAAIVRQVMLAFTEERRFCTSINPDRQDGNYEYNTQYGTGRQNRQAVVCGKSRLWLGRCRIQHLFSDLHSVSDVLLYRCFRYTGVCCRHHVSAIPNF